MGKRMTYDNTDPDSYPDSDAYRTSFEEWMGAHNGTLPEHLTAGQINSVGYVPNTICRPYVTKPEDWAEFVWNDMHAKTRQRLMDHLIEVLADDFEALPGYHAAAAEWADGNRMDLIDTALGEGWGQR